MSELWKAGDYSKAVACRVELARDAELHVGVSGRIRGEMGYDLARLVIGDLR